MSVDRDELRRLAEAANGTAKQWYDPTAFDILHSDDAEFAAAASPHIVLSLLAELEEAAGKVTAFDGCDRARHAAEVECHRLREALAGLAKQADATCEYLTHGVDPSNESDVRLSLLEGALVDARRALGGECDHVWNREHGEAEHTCVKCGTVK